MAVYLVCEGLLSGLDRRVLQALVIEHHNLNVLIEPAGGGKGHNAVRAYLESRSSKDVAIAIEDRDYRLRTVADATCANRAGKSFTWRQHEIENYLLHPSIVLELFHDFRALGAAWASSLPAKESDVSTLLQSHAGLLLEDHAGEMLKDEVVREINRFGSLSFGPSRLRRIPPGPHTLGQAQLVLALQQEATRLCQTCTGVAALSALQPAAIAARYSAQLAQVQNSDFLATGAYQVDMKGKDLLAALSRYLVGCGAPARLNQEALSNELLRVLTRNYRPNTISQPDDFFELATILGQY